MLNNSYQVPKRRTRCRPETSCRRDPARVLPSAGWRVRMRARMNHRSQSLWASPEDWLIHPYEEPVWTNPRPDSMNLPQAHPATNSANKVPASPAGSGRCSSPGSRSLREVSASPRSGRAPNREVERRVCWVAAVA